MERATKLSRLWAELLAVRPELARFVRRGRRGPKADDRVQEVMTRAFARLPSYVPHEDGVRPWAFGIAKNVERETRRAERRERRVFSADTSDAEPAGRGRTPEEDAFLAEARTKLTAAISTMPERYLAVFMLVDLMDVSYEETAEKLRISIGTVKSRRSAAIDHLRYHLGEREDWIGALFVRLRRSASMRRAYEWAYQAAHVCGPIIFAVACMHGPEPERTSARALLTGAARALTGLITDVASVVPDDVTPAPAPAPSDVEPQPRASPPPARPRTQEAPDATDEGASTDPERSTTEGRGWSL
ncbi:RNA polymerase sigma factor [Polyangium spumosum]|uniref:Sigma-70 family RNA polymerase sigma factor n=1 Tax=Polyangium spumosum TaxID=889282 RepID=A0A6N7Q4K1_9BACT|nr:sigma-70 family RNA polymerase sigma factor [Polyangium spumosum]MRG97820.1 sigma-70 family RNA polymerase sigma factor [Polyangium spumosum]